MYDVAQSVLLSALYWITCAGLTVGNQPEPVCVCVVQQARAIEGEVNQVFSTTQPVTASLYAFVMLKVEIISGQTVIKHGKNGMAESQKKRS